MGNLQVLRRIAVGSQSKVKCHYEPPLRPSVLPTSGCRSELVEVWVVSQVPRRAVPVNVIHQNHVGMSTPSSLCALSLPLIPIPSPFLYRSLPPFKCVMVERVKGLTLPCNSEPQKKQRSTETAPIISNQSSPLESTYH
ncbi:hypothetical protein E2C01_029371 [Portunus trituberculatus]|uniref:Uncharacterized protein n=1 Tax=Portunus trituberculatus TaxID=210409 RepID=A0A5B7EP28_PORTR|nr:hypothetical protein [Portunus trituberculatus]